MKLILGVAGIFLLMATISIAGFLGFNDSEDIAMIASAVGNEEDCKVQGNSAIDVLSAVSWVWFQVPGVSARYMDNGGSFMIPAFRALRCRPGQAQYRKNLDRVKRSIRYGIAQGESIDRLAPNGINLVHGAVLTNQPELLRFLADEGASLELPTAADATFNGADVGNRTALALLDLDRGRSDSTDELYQILGARGE